MLPKKRFTFNRAIFIDRDLKRINIDRNIKPFFKAHTFFVKIHNLKKLPSLNEEFPFTTTTVYKSIQAMHASRAY